MPRSALRWLIIMSFGVLALVCVFLLDPTYRLMYNPSSSAPRGWYLRIPLATLERRTLILARLPDGIAAFAAARDYLPLTVPILKPVAALGGQMVCERAGEVSIDGTPVAHALMRDGAGRPLPHWTGCRTLNHDEIFLLSDYNPASFDSRYFGPLRRAAVIGKVLPLWTW